MCLCVVCKVLVLELELVLVLVAALAVRTLRVVLVALRHKRVQSANVLKAFSALVKGWSRDCYCCLCRVHCLN